MKTTALLAAGVLTIIGAPSTFGTILLNEIHMRTPPSSGNVEADSNFEFVELRSTTNGVEQTTGLWILILDADGGNIGVLEEAWELKNADGPLATGTNGLLLLGDDYTDPGSPYQNSKAPQTTMADPSGMGPDNIPNNAICVLLVSGYLNPAPNLGTNVDFDVDDDGLLDWTETPVPAPPAFQVVQWTTVVDSVGFNGDQGAAVKPNSYVGAGGAGANLSRNTAALGTPQVNSAAVNFIPHTMARRLDINTANNRSAWYGGTVSGTTGDATAYGTNFFNIGSNFKGLVTPGRPNINTAPTAPVFRINEVNLNPPTAPGRSPDENNPAILANNDGNFEYIEIINTTSTAGDASASLNGFALLIIDSSGPVAGEIREAWDLSRFATGSNGLLLIGNDYNNRRSPFAKMIDAATQLADPSVAGDDPKWTSLGQGDIGGNNGFTVMLVSNFTGNKGDDLDTNDDGVREATPYTLVDSLSIPEINDPDNDGKGTLVTGRNGYATGAIIDLQVPDGDPDPNNHHYNVDNLSRILGSNTANAASQWVAGILGARSPYSLCYRVGYHTSPEFRGAATPGRPNHSISALPTVGTIRLNEIQLNPPTPVDNSEYIELISANPSELTRNMWLLVIRASGANSGIVDKAFDLRGLSTGANRLALIGDGVEEATNVLFPYISGQTLTDDPRSFNFDGTENTAAFFNFTPDSIANDGVSILLVSYSGAALTPVTPGADLDANNDGVLDAAATWTLVDGVSTGNGIGGVPIINPGYQPANLSRVAGNMTANSAAAWVGGELAGATATSFAYGANFFGTFQGAATPGRHNASAPLNESAQVLLNEVNINPPGADNEKEFFELLSTSGGAMSTAGYSILIVDSDGADVGTVLNVYDLDSAATGANGLLLAGSGYGPGTIPWVGAAAPEAQTRLFSPDGLSFDDVGASNGNLGITILLVKNFTGRVGDDLDMGTNANVSAADDLIFNSPVPWQIQADSVAMRGYNNNAVPPALEGSIFVGTANVTQALYTPDTVARFRFNTTANSTAAWYGGNLAGTAGTTTAYSATEFFPSTLLNGVVTPGQANVMPITDNSDLDGDGVTYLMEQALGMNHLVHDRHKLPTYTVLTIGANKHPTLRVTRPQGAAGFIYSGEGSVDLMEWPIPLTAQPAVNNGDGTETVNFIVPSFYLPIVNSSQKVFLRLRVRRS